jgi:hypothetical protein
MSEKLIFDGTFWTAVTAFLGAAAAAAGVWAFFLTNQETRKKDAELARDIAGANERAAEVNLKTAQIYEKLRWRHLAKASHNSLVASLRNSDCDPIVVLTAPGDPEASQYSSEIKAAIAEAGKLDENSQHPSTAGIFTGHMMPFGLYFLRQSRDSDKTIKAVNDLINAFNQAGLPVKEFTVVGMLPDILRLQVGYNPNMTMELTNPPAQPKPQ